MNHLIEQRSGPRISALPRSNSRRMIHMALNKVEICGVNTSKLPVLTAEEKDFLFERIKAGDEKARELYIKGNLRLV